MDEGAELYWILDRVDGRVRRVTCDGKKAVMICWLVQGRKMVVVEEMGGYER